MTQTKTNMLMDRSIIFDNKQPNLLGGDTGGGLAAEIFHYTLATIETWSTMQTMASAQAQPG